MRLKSQFENLTEIYIIPLFKKCCAHMNKKLCKSKYIYICFTHRLHIKAAHFTLHTAQCMLRIEPANSNTPELSAMSTSYSTLNIVHCTPYINIKCCIFITLNWNIQRLSGWHSRLTLQNYLEYNEYNTQLQMWGLPFLPPHWKHLL